MAKHGKPTLTQQKPIISKPKSFKENLQGCVTLIIIFIVGSMVFGYCNSDKSNRQEASSSEDALPYVEPQEEKGRLRGVWYDEQLSLTTGKKTGYKFISSGGKLYVAACNPDEENLQAGASTTLSPLATELVINKTQFTNAENPNEYYLVNAEEDLLIYDEAGLVVKCKRIFYDDGN